MSADFTHLYSPHAEQSVIGALLLDPSAVDRIGTLRPEHCFSEDHRLLLGQILSMIGAGQPVDAVTVAEALHDRGMTEQTGGLAYLGELAANTPSARSIGRYAEQVLGKALERQLLAASATIRDTVEGTGTTAEKLSAAQAAVMSISESVARSAPRLLREVLLSAAEVLEQRASGQVQGLPTGFVDLDRQLSGGLRPGNVVILAGRPAMGKTALALNVAYRVALAGAPALVLSLEMSEQELADRLIAQAGSVYLSDVLAGKMSGDTGDRIMGAVGQLHALPLILDDQGGLTLFDVASKARSVKRQHGLSLLVIDYLQLMSGEGDNRNQQIDGMTRGLKALAKELAVPIIVLSQLSRKCEERTNRRPMASDLRDSGAIEQDADVILFVYRDEIYNEHSSDKGTAEILVAKNRQGPTGMVRLAYQGCYTRFDNLAASWQPDPSVDPAPKKRRGMDGY